MKRVFLMLMALALLSTVFVACEQSSYTQDRKTQEEILIRAQKVEPAYQTQNFLARKAINEYMKRMDTPDKLWYVYLYADSGAFIGYHISRTYPISIAVGMTNPSQRIKGYEVVVPAPGIDGVFYNGVDPTLYYCFDAETDAMIMFTTEFIAYDFPLDLDVPLLKIKVE